MLRKPHIRRPLVAFLVVLGGVLMFLAPETWPGTLLMALGVSVEVIGITIRHRDE